ncbi:MAG: hypothetical protein GY777_16850 [Candidatus Brocadiaceae bacterium]|nr:hypothetical protein [Candidatus Brocadiaceae bacterium]
MKHIRNVLVNAILITGIVFVLFTNFTLFSSGDSNVLAQGSEIEAKPSENEKDKKKNEQTNLSDDVSVLGQVMGYVAISLIGLFGIIVLWKMAFGPIDLTNLISETDGSGASLSRFQFLIFTFVISMSLLWVILTLKGFPSDIPNDIFVLLGISAGSYAISKGIQKSPTGGGAGNAGGVAGAGAGGGAGNAGGVAGEAGG